MVIYQCLVILVRGGVPLVHQDITDCSACLVKMERIKSKCLMQIALNVRVCLRKLVKMLITPNTHGKIPYVHILATKT